MIAVDLIERVGGKGMTPHQYTQDTLILAMAIGFSIRADARNARAHENILILGEGERLFEKFRGGGVAGTKAENAGNDLFHIPLLICHIEAATE
jgi:hypothetical protein